MKRIVVVLAVAALMAAMMVASAAPAFAQTVNVSPNLTTGNIASDNLSPNCDQGDGDNVIIGVGPGEVEGGNNDCDGADVDLFPIDF